MTIAAIADAEAGSSVRTKLNAVLGKTNFLGPRAGKVWGPWGMQIAAASTLNLNTIGLVPFPVHETMTVSAFVCRITTLAAGGNIQLAVYASDPTTGMPTGNALGTTASQTTAATGVFSLALAGSNFQMTPGVYWWAVNSDNTTVVMASVATGQEWSGALVGAASAANSWSGTTNIGLSWTVAQTFGTWPDLTGGSFTEATNNKCCCFKFSVASVP